jgi:tetratricopeptide (TPR) repeat protein
MLLVPVLLLTAVEGALRLFGVAAPPPLFKAVRHSAFDGYVTNAAVGERYFSPAMRTIMPHLGFQHFPRQKDPRAVRYFCLGGSSMAGFPYHTHASISGRLAARLQRLLPGRPIEPVNCAMTAVGSHTAVDFMPEVLAHEPDFLIIYMGHNEFYGAWGVGSTSSLGHLTWAVSAARFLLDLRLAAIIRSTLGIGHARAPRRGSRNVMETMVGERHIPPGSPLRAAAEAIFARNLRRILGMAAARGVPVLLCEVSSNLRTQAPFGSCHRPGFAEEERFERLLRSAGAKEAAGNLSGALEDLAAAAQLDDSHAAVHYQRGRILDALGRFAEAAAEYAAAREHDTVPFRAPAGINRVIRQEAARAGIPVVAVDSLLKAHAEDGIPGSGIFLEHLHLSARGSELIAEHLANCLFTRQLIAPQEAWRWDRNLSGPEYAALAGVTELDLEVGDRRVHMLKQKWPYRRTAGPAEPYVSSREKRVTQLAAAVVRKEIELNDAHTELGCHYRELGRTADALGEFLSSYRMFPFDAVPAREAGRLLAAMGRAAEARGLLAQALAIDPQSEETLLLLGRLLAACGQQEQAAELGRRALALRPGSRAAREFLASLQAQHGAQDPQP